MELPIDYRSGPFREKYIDTETAMLNRWFIFGRYFNGSVGISDGTNDIFEYVPAEKAKRICAARDAFVSIIVTELNQRREG